MVDVGARSEGLDAVVSSLVSMASWPDATFVRLPLVYPGGSLVAVKIQQIGTDRYHVSDGAFGYRHLEEIGAHRSFVRTASAIAEEMCLKIGSQTLYCEVAYDDLFSAITDVSSASLRMVDHIYSKQKEEIHFVFV